MSQSDGRPDLRRFREFLWPTIDSRDAARRAATLGAIAGGFVAVNSAFAPDLARTFGIESSLWLNAGFALAWVALALGIRAMSRVAAVVALVLFVLERGLSLQHTNRGVAIILAILFTIFFITAVRATTRYHELPPADGGANARQDA